MILRAYERARRIHPEFPKYLAALTLMAVCGGVFENTYNNYLHEQFHISPEARGKLELVREFPGLMNAVLMAGLAFLPETRVAALAAVVTAVGVAGFGVRGDMWGLMLVWTVLWGIGSHLLMPIQSSLTMELGGQTQRGKRLGQVGAVSVVGSIVGAAVVWLVFSLGSSAPHAAAGAQMAEGEAGRTIAQWQFDSTFYFAAVACVAAAWFFLKLRSVGAHSKRPSLVLKKRYWLYYVLNVLFGARKQVFLTFGRWVLVVVFLEPPSTFAKVWIVASIIGIFFNPAVGKLIDRLGERKVLFIDSFVLVVVCFGYGAAEHLGLSHEGARVVVLTAFVVDQLFFAVGMARETYMSKIAETKEDLTASLSLGVTINHIIAATVPTFGGMLWEAYHYESVFMAAGGVAVLMMVFSNFVRVPRSTELREAA
jgi:hypothetical protein